MIRRPPRSTLFPTRRSSDLTETLVHEIADAMVNGGLLAAGYDTLTLHDCWSAGSPHSSGNLTNDPVKFPDRKSTPLNSSHVRISYAVFCLKKKKKKHNRNHT